VHDDARHDPQLRNDGSGDMAIAGTEHWVDGTSAHDGARLRLYLWEKRDAAAPAKDQQAVLLVHGSRRSARVAFDLPVPLAPGEFSYSLMGVLAGRGFDTFALDIQCYGRSDHHPSGLAVTTETAASDIAAAVEYICRLRDVDQVLLVGWSWGATTAAIYAENHPQRVRRLVLYGGRYMRLNVADGGPLAVSIAEHFCVNTTEVSTLTLQPKLTVPKVLETWLAEGERWDPTSPNGVASDFQTRMPLSRPERIAMPVMILYGGEDFQLRQMPAIADYFARLAATDRHFSIVPGGGHAAHLHQTRERFAKILLGFLEG
jgi:pimeloyl-ACP methyl ester carboxylesterase